MIVAWLKDEKGDQVQSEKLLEIDFSDGRLHRALRLRADRAETNFYR